MLGGGGDEGVCVKGGEVIGGRGLGGELGVFDGGGCLGGGFVGWGGRDAYLLGYLSARFAVFHKSQN